MRILIADDQKHSRQGLRALLGTVFSQPEFWEASTGNEAVRLAEEVRPDLIVMDVRMPGLDGLAATRCVKSRRPEIKILVLSMYPGYGAEASAAGADAFLGKGEPPERLLSTLSSLVT